MAVKVMTASHSENAAELESFRREARLISRYPLEALPPSVLRLHPQYIT